MLTPFDDYPVHQTPEPIAHLASGDRNFYDRYFFNGYSTDGGVFFAAALGVYPNRRVMDAAFSVVIDGRQISLHASRRVRADATETAVGPIRVSVDEPMRTLRLSVAPNDFEIEGELVFRARSAALEEPRFIHRFEHQVVMDYTRLTQFGCWEGTLRVSGQEIQVTPSQFLGCRDRSWGVRPVGEPANGAPGSLPQFFWLWAPLQFDDLCTHFAVNEDSQGRPWHNGGSVLQTLPEGGGDPLDPGLSERMRSVSHSVTWQPGTRRASSATLTLTPFEEKALTIELTPILTFQMLGLGYLHPVWGHGLWKGELAVDGEVWRLDDLDPMEPRYLHVQQLCRAHMGERSGLGVFEQLVIGPHAPSGFTSLFDPAGPGEL